MFWFNYQNISTNHHLFLYMHQKLEDPLHGKRLDTILEELVDYYNGFEELGKQINIKCFNENPSIKSSLKFLRKTDWARTKVESLYLYVLRQKNL
ncbi:uncharacterized protein (DUF2132 family) [Chryseobacterium sp. 16F]|uniref:Uncharacterized protein (DUF2132 family) n=2 Tax=Frigoriflavimonas asaccharolytica TaxID=2735899 RepID=A0A8J8G607_9FLAO|nr:uncharacterized protein (DUF2132 family) [Frigoriflavimonas asaccharolytica]